MIHQAQHSHIRLMICIGSNQPGHIEPQCPVAPVLFLARTYFGIRKPSGKPSVTLLYPDTDPITKP